MEAHKSHYVRLASIHTVCVLCLLLSVSMQQACCRDNVQPSLTHVNDIIAHCTCAAQAMTSCPCSKCIRCTLIQSVCYKPPYMQQRQHQAAGQSMLLVCCSSIDRTLPFELRALEAALAHTCRSLEQESIQVERATLPALKSLMQKVGLLWSYYLLVWVILIIISV